jgi:hypothetical protein
LGETSRENEIRPGWMRNLKLEFSALIHLRRIMAIIDEHVRTRDGRERARKDDCRYVS